jgi:hypothetical protein
MDTKEQLRHIIRKELMSVLEEQSKNWWHTPADTNGPHLDPHQVHEQGEKKKRPRVGKKKSGRFTSAGSVPNKIGRKLTPSQISNREQIGKKMLNALRRGGPAASNFRDKLNAQLDARDKPTDRMHQYSMIWANASSIAARGGTAADWNVSDKKKKSKEEQ